MTDSLPEAFASLPNNWRVWLLENAARGCTSQSMYELLIENCAITPEIAKSVVEQAIVYQQRQFLPSRPDVNTRENMLDAAGQIVEIVMTLLNPRIVVFRNVLTDKECDALVSMSSQRQARSTVVESASGLLEEHDERTSYGAVFQRGENELITLIENRLAFLCNWPVNHAEGLQVLRYGPGDEYKPHFDWFDPEQPGPSKHMEHGGQRVGTLVMYLSDVEEGGGTSFPNIGLEVRPHKGGAVFFADIDELGAPDQQTLHAGLPVIKGVKIIATKWMRQRVY